jgi:hypothetical protein
LVQVPLSLMMIRNGLHALTRKLVTEVLFSSLVTLLTMAILTNVTKPILPFARDDGQQSPSVGKLAGEATGDVLADFMQRVALSHVTRLKAPVAATSQATLVAVSEPATAAVIPLPPRPPIAPRHDRLSPGKVHVAANAPKIPLPAPPPIPTVEPAVASAPVKAEPLPPLQYGMRLVTNLGTIITASETCVVESVASVGDTLNSFVKKL